MTVFDDVQQYRTLLGIQWYEEGVVKDEQLATLDLLEFSLYCILGLCHLERTEELRRVGIQSPYSVLTGMITHCRCQEALAGSRRAIWFLVSTYSCRKGTNIFSYPQIFASKIDQERSALPLSLSVATERTP